MRIGLLIYGSLDTLSGGYLYDRLLVEYLQQRGDQVVIVSLPVEKYFFSLRHNFMPSLRKRLNSLQVDILLEDELCHPSLFWINKRIKALLSRSVIAIVHHLRSSENHPQWQKRIYRIIECLFLESVDGYVFNSHATRQSVEQLVPQGKPSVIAQPGGDHMAAHISPEEISFRAHQPGPLRLLFLGNLIPRKGLHTLLYMLSHLPRRQWTLTVVGSLEMDRQYSERVLKLTRSLGLGDRVLFTGPLVDAELTQVMRTHHLLVLPSSYEGYGIAYIEGMGFGLPAIATRAGGAVEIITHGENGYLIPPEDSGILAQVLSDLIEDRDRLETLSLKALQRYHSHPTWNETSERIRNFLGEFL